MAGERAEGAKPPGQGGIAAELVAAGFLDAVEVGRGGAGIVYRCHQTSLARSVAIKVLMSDFDQDNRERFLREGLAMGRLSGHPNIENILQVGVTDSNRPYIVMPYHEAGSLAQRLHRVGRIEWHDALRIAVKLCGALETAHRTGTLHRDIKPGNVLVNDYGEPQLSDFGIARISGGYETATGFFTGTIAFTAPEVLAGSPPTTASDVYSLGATIYALIAGTAAHERKSDEDLIAHYLRISSTPVPDMRPQGIPANVCAAIEKAMSLDPTKRHASAADFGHEMQLAQRHNGLIPDSMVLSETNGESGRVSQDRQQTRQQCDLRPSVRLICLKLLPSHWAGRRGQRRLRRFRIHQGPTGPPSRQARLGRSRQARLDQSRQARVDQSRQARGGRSRGPTRQRVRVTCGVRRPVSSVVSMRLPR